MYYFLREDLIKLDQEIERVKSEIDKALKETGDSCGQSSETWHDNFGYEEGVRQSRMWSKRLSELLPIRREAMIIDRPVNPESVMVGARVKIREVVSQEEITILVGSYFTLSDTEISPEGQKVSYEAPLAKILMGAKTGDFRQGQIGKVKKTFKVLEIS